LKKAPIPAAMHRSSKSLLGAELLVSGVCADEPQRMRLQHQIGGEDHQVGSRKRLTLGLAAQKAMLSMFSINDSEKTHGALG
jgi:hypothetical protein